MTCCLCCRWQAFALLGRGHGTGLSPGGREGVSGNRTGSVLGLFVLMVDAVVVIVDRMFSAAAEVNEGVHYLSV